MHVPFKIHYRNNLIDKKDYFLIQRPPSWDDRNYSYGHQHYHNDIVYQNRNFFIPKIIVVFRTDLHRMKINTELCCKRPTTIVIGIIVQDNKNSNLFI